MGKDLFMPIAAQTNKNPSIFSAQHDTDIVLRRDTHRFQIITAPQCAALLGQALCKTTKLVGSSCWEWLDIQAGIPIVQPAPTLEALVPQMLNFEVIGGVSFKKGCYPVPKIIAHMLYLGKLKRRMILAHVEGDVASQVGDELYSAEMEGQSCGTVVNGLPVLQGGVDLLAVVQNTSHDAFPVHLGTLTGTRLQFQPPPPLP